jgi:ferrochelatase
MVDYTGEPEFAHHEIPAVGVLVTNVGTPDAPTAPALRRYLKQFLSDPRVIEKQGLVWKLILHGMILRRRPSRSAAAYRSVWTEAGSPLLATIKSQAEGIEARLRGNIGSPIHVAVGMGYGSPSIASGLDELRRKSCRRILVLPLFPQYAAATTGSTFDAVADVLKQWRWVPELRTITHYHDHPGYIQALAASIRELWSRQGEPEKLLLSFHGLPRSMLLAGDPYHCQCHKTARLLSAALELADDRWLLSFQSRFGREEWLRPYTDETLKAWGKSCVGRVDVVCPGFSADCLETVEEIGAENRANYLDTGGGQYRYIPALNVRPDHLDLLKDVAERNLHGWVTWIEKWDENAARAEAEATQKRAETERRSGPNS